MIEIKGKYNSAKVFVDDYDKLEEALLNTIKKTCKKYIEQIKLIYHHQSNF